MANSFTRHIPNSITCCNLICGCVAIYYAFLSLPQTAFLFIILGAVFDFFDGLSARLLGVSSPVGKELDSLADVVTFGVAPSAMVFELLVAAGSPQSLGPAGVYLPFAAFLIAALSGLRLARFNLDERQATSFIGLPTPANALFWGSLIVGGGDLLASLGGAWLIILLLVLVSCKLLVAEIPMFALKFKSWGWRGNEVKYIFVLTCLPMLFFLGIAAFAAIIAWYVLLSVVTNMFKR